MWSPLVLLLLATPSLCLPQCRCTPNQECWPTQSDWDLLNVTVSGRLSRPISPVAPCIGETINSQDCRESLERLGQDPFWLQTMPGGTESTGHLNGWTAMPSEYAVEAMNEEDIVAAINFAREFDIRVVVKGTGHDYYGRSSSPNSLLIWTHSMRGLTFHDEFQPTECDAGCTHSKTGIPAVTADAGITWVDVYLEATDRNLYVQGGGCTSVGVVGWLIGGGYGSFSKMFGTGPANLLEAKVVTADGRVVIANECTNSDLFFALRGGGFGFGVVVSMTMRTHPIPHTISAIFGGVQAATEEAFFDLVTKFLDFYKTSLMGIHYGEQFGIVPSSKYLDLTMVAANLTKEQIINDMQPFLGWLSQNSDKFTYSSDIISMPGNLFWSVGEWNQDFVEKSPYDPLEPERAFFWKENIAEISSYWLKYSSRFLRVDQFLDDVSKGAKMLIDLAAHTGSATVHTNKAQFLASQWAVDELELTAMHPSIKDSFGLVITGARVDHYSPLVPQELQANTSNILDIVNFCGSEDLSQCPTLQIYEEGFKNFREVTPGAGAYFNEGDYFEPDFQEAFWGRENYERLKSIKVKWDPTSLFYCHNCVGSEDWQEGGMCRI